MKATLRVLAGIMVLSFLVFPETLCAMVEISGTLSNDTTWTNTDTVRVTGDVTVSSSATLTVEAGSIVLFNAATNLYVSGGLSADGSSGSRIVFSSIADTTGGSPLGGDWNQIRFQTNSTGLLDNCEIRYAATGVYVYNSSPDMDSCLISNFSTTGITAKGSSATSYPVSITDCIIRQDDVALQGTGRGIWIDRDIDATIGGCDISYCSYGMDILSATANKTTVHATYCDIHDNASHGLVISGGGPAPLGSVQYCNFDDNAGYDVYVNNGGYQTWKTYFFDAQFNWWGSAEGYAAMDRIYDHMNNYSGYYSSAIVNCSGVLDAPYPGGSVQPEYICGGFTSDSTVIDLGTPYKVNGVYYVPATRSVTIDPGVQFNFGPGTGLYVEGDLQAAGQTGDPIIYTASADTVGGSPVAGDWTYVSFSPNSSGLVRHGEVHYATNGVSVNNSSPDIDSCLITDFSSAGILAKGSSSTSYPVSITDCVIRQDDVASQGTGRGIWIDRDIDATISRCDISYCYYGMDIVSAAANKTTADVTYCDIHDNASHGFMISGGGPAPLGSVQYCNFDDNAGYDVFVGNGGYLTWKTYFFDAQFNWWGTHEGYAAIDRVYDHMDNPSGYYASAIVNCSGALDAPYPGGSVQPEYISGAFVSDSTVTDLGTPYKVNGYYYVPSTRSVTIDPGVQFNFGPLTALYVEGDLQAVGQTGNPIVYTSSADTLGGSPAAGSWNTVYFMTNATGLVRHGLVRYANHGIYAYSCSPDIDSCEITDFGSSGIWADGRASNPAKPISISDCVIRQDQVSLQGTGRGIYLFIGVDATVTRCDISYCENGMFISDSQNPARAPLFNVTYCDIHDNSSHGVNVNAPWSGAAGSIQYCNFDDNAGYDLYTSAISYNGWKTKYLDAQFNWWGTHEGYAALDRVYDRQDNGGTYGSPIVNCSGPLDAPYPGGSVQPEYISGAFVSDSTVTDLGTPYKVNGFYYVPATRSVTIDPGVQFNFGPSTLLYVEGDLQAVGQTGDPIIYTSSADTLGGSPVPGDWSYVLFVTDATGLFRHGDVRYAATGVYLSHASLDIDSCTITDFTSAGIRASGYSSNPPHSITITDCVMRQDAVSVQGTGRGVLIDFDYDATISRCDISYCLEGIYAINRYANRTLMNVTYCDIHDNSSNGIGLYTHSDASNAPQSSIHYCDFETNAAYDVYAGRGAWNANDTVDARYNWWEGAVDSATIANDHIYDRLDNSYSPVVLFIPFVGGKGQLVASTIPAQNALNVLASTDISVTFNIDMDSSTINDTTFIVHGKSTGFYTGTIDYDSLTKTATFNPATDFPPGEVVTATLTEEIESLHLITLLDGYAWTFTTEVDDGSGVFGTQTTYATGDDPRAVFVADFDGDGDPDVATANYGTGDNVSILLNNGDGTFATHADYSCGLDPGSIHAADLDSDNDLDLVVGSQSDASVSVLMNNGNGTFGGYTTYSVSSAPYDVFAADLNGDGDYDIASATPAFDEVSILLNNGHGTFGSYTSYGVGDNPIALFAGDVDNDGDLDVVTANTGSYNISVILNSGDGTFGSATDYSVGAAPQAVCGADLDDDGYLDLATVDPASNRVSVFLNNGDGTFGTSSTFDVGTGPQSLQAGDVDNDDDLDLVTSNTGSYDVSVIRNDGAGSFGLPLHYDVDEGTAVDLADFDLDGALDVVTANAGTDNISILLNLVCVDTDADGYGDPGYPENECAVDNCPSDYNPGQEDNDTDGLGDVCDDDDDDDGVLDINDNCQFVANPGQEDNDTDGIGDACDDDDDNDGVPDGSDNCPFVANPGQEDADSDGLGDVCDDCTDTDGDGFGDPGYPANTCAEDNCPSIANPGQEDADADGIGDLCDDCTDTDGDGFGDPGYPANTCTEDNCPSIANPGQEDADADGIGDLCDDCTDTDGDGFGDPGFPANTCAEDNCPSIANPGQEDADADGIGDLCDDCTDTDGDGFGDPGFPANTCAEDNCPSIANPGQEDADADGIGDLCDDCTDTDGDGVGDPGYPANTCAEDNCPTIANPGQEDADADGIGDLCDDCTDTDGDGFGDPGYPANTCAEDNCPTIANPGQEDADADGIGDLCDDCTDTDGDGFGDPGFPANTCAEDNCPSIANPGQEDADADGIGDLCDDCTDTDGDGFGDPGYPANTCAEDNCPTIANPGQEDADADGIGDLCDDCTDTDGDGFGDPGFPANTCPEDNCPTVANPGQEDTDADGVGDVCDDDDDDGVLDINDNCPTIANPGQEDADTDGIGDVCDECTDTDGDGYGDPGYPVNTCPEDNCPTIANPGQEDADADGIGDVCDECTDTDGDGYGDPGYPANTCAEDNCPSIANPGQEDADADGIGDVCDECTDTDGDGYGDPGYPVNTCAEDNCPSVANPGQEDADADGIGDICDDCVCIHQCDYDTDGFLTSVDLGALIDVLFAGRPEEQDPQCAKTRGDFDCDGFPTSVDLGYLIDHLFAGGDPPCAPCAP